MGIWPTCTGVSEEADSASVGNTASCVQIVPLGETAMLGVKKQSWVVLTEPDRKPTESKSLLPRLD